MARSIKTANFLMLNRSREFAWGDWDCNLFVVDLLDHIDADMPWRSQAIRGKYHTRLGACRFQHAYTPAPEFLQRNGFVIVQKDSTQFCENDIILETKKRFWAASLFFAGRTWTVIEEKALMMNVIEPGSYQVAEYHG